MHEKIMQEALTRTNAICIILTMNGEQIKAVRANLKESQAVFAERFGVDQSTVHRWEENGIPDRGTTAVLIEKVFAELPKSLTADEVAT